MAPLTQAWVTCVTDDITFVQSLVLARSLRRVYTSRKTVVIITRNITRDKRCLLEKEFDAVLLVDSESTLSSGISEELLAVLYCWKLTLFQKCVFIESNTLIYKNCDDLFNAPQSSQISAFPDEMNKGFQTSIYVYKPSIQTFHLMTSFAEKRCLLKKGNQSQLLNLYWTKWNNLIYSEEKLWKNCVAIIPRSGELQHFGVYDCSSIKIVMHTGKNLKNLVQQILDSNQLAKNNFLHANENLFGVWLDIFHKDVIPNLQQFGIDIKSCIGDQHEYIHKVPASQNGKIVTVDEFAKDGFDYLNDGIAIIGMSCKFPNANNTEELWELLIQGQDAISTVPENRANLGWENFDMKTKGGFLKCPIDEFDGKFFGISPREAIGMDPQQRLLLEVAWEALEDAGINPIKLKGSQTGVFVGAWTLGYERLMTESQSDIDFQRVYLGTGFGPASGRVSFQLGLNGPNIVTESGCSSSMVSLHLACESLRSNNCTMALAGGVNLLVQPWKIANAEHVLSPDGRCKSFDESADGFVRAEGCGILVLKKYSEAIKNGDRVLGLIRGSALSQEGTSSSFGTPTKLSQEIAIRKALKTAGISPSETKNITYIEAHGTGTAVGDPVEIAAIGSVYKRDNKEDPPLLIGSVKTNIGHTESAAGVAGVIKVLMSFKNGTIPAHKNLAKLNPLIDLDAIPAKIPLEAVPWKRSDGGLRMAAVSSFGISGSNVHMIIQEPFITQTRNTSNKNNKGTIDPPFHILTLSAKNTKALQDLTNNYKDYLQNNLNFSVADICYTSNIGRAHFAHRLAFVGNSCQDLVDQLNEQSNRSFSVSVCTEVQEGTKVAFLFTGQGSQYAGMGKQLYMTQTVFRQAVNHCADIIQSNFGVSLLNFLLNGTDSELGQTIYSQTSIFCIEYALCQLWNSFGVKPDCVLGHSTGEFAAAVAAGMMSLEDALKLVYMRSELLQSLPEGGMMAVMGNVYKVKNLVQAFNNSNANLWLDVAVVNSDDEVVVAGRPKSLEIFQTVCQEANMKTKLLAASQAFHSRDVDLILDEFEDVALTMKYSGSNCTYISGTTGDLLTDKGLSSNYWKNHAKSSVNFNRAIKTLQQENCNVLIEIGANPVLLALALSNVTSDQSSKAIWLPSMRKGEDNLLTLLDSLKKVYVHGLEINWEGFHCSYVGHRSKVSLPKYPFQRQSYWFEKTNFVRNVHSKENLLHPLVGRKISLVTSDEIYQHTLDLKNLSFIEHHKVANKIIMPGACFLEMVLVAGFATFTQCGNDSLPEPSAPLSIDNFVIEAPLELKEGSFVDIQLVVTRSESEDKESSGLEFTASVHQKLMEEGSEGNWKRHATGTFSMFSSFEDRQVNLGEIQGRCTNISTTESLYEGFLKIGLDFGSLFRSISKVWKNDSEILAEIPLPKEAGKLEEYMCHPILIDALIQCSALSAGEGKDLYLPVGVKKFVWFSRKICPYYYAHSKIVGGKVFSVKLYDDCGNLLVLMEGIQIVRSSVTSFLKAVNVEKKLPGMYTEYWRENDNSPKKTFDLSNGIKPKEVEHQIWDTVEILTKTEEEIGALLKKTDGLLGLQIFKALKNVGWEPFIGEKLTAADFVSQHIIVPRFRSLIVRFFTSLTEDGFLECESETEYGLTRWKVVRLPSEDSLTEEFLNDILLSIANPMATDMYEICLPCMEQLPQALLGKESMLTSLFSSKNDDDISIAEKMYSETIIMKSSNVMFGKILQCMTEDIIQKNKQAGILRVLEVGAGTGGTSKHVLKYLETMKIPFKYTYTDISSVLISKASKKFGDSIEYKILNIENDPKIQGYIPYSYDIVIASNVIHATEDLAVSIKNIRHLLAPHGYLMLFEILMPLRILDVVFGSVEGFSRFKDTHIRKHSPIVGGKVWESIMRENGFQHTVTLETSGPRAGIVLGKASEDYFPYEAAIKTNDSLLRPTRNIWIIFSNLDNFSLKIEENLKNIGKNVSIIQRSSEYKVVDNYNFYLDPTKKEMVAKMYDSLLSSQDIKIEGIVYNWGMFVKDNEQEMLQGLLYLSQNILTSKSISFPKLFVFTRGAHSIYDDEIVNPAAGSFSGFMNTLKNEQHNLQCFCVDLDPDSIVSPSEINNILWASHNYNLIAIRSGIFYSPRAREISTSSSSLKFPNSSRFKIILPESKSIADVALGPSERFPIGNETQIEIAVKAVGLNFRDVLIIMKPDGYSSFFDTEIGTDFAGVVVSVGSKVKRFKPGDEIFGASFRGSLNSHAIVQSELSCMKPKHVTFLEAATLPSVYHTAYHCLINIAKLTNKDVVLIHVASGGVGLIAIQLAQEIGARIIATAGSRRKRAYLRLLGIQHVFHSRDTSYGKGIEELKNSGIDGVDVVLNSLTSPGFKEASLRVCRKNARFVEIGKINIWQPEEVRKLREDVDYSIVNLENLSLEIMNTMVQKLEEDVSNKKIKPLPFTRFEMGDVREALNYLKRAYHVGKVVVAIPECRLTNGNRFEFVEKLFDSESTYLITGGLGGIGLEVAKWMATSGARNIVLVGRSHPNEAAQDTVKLIRDQGVNVIIEQVDVGDFIQCQKLLQVCSDTLPPLRGVMHAAGALSDAIIINQTWEKFETVFNAKVKGAWNLHILTQKCRLEHFVLYSSASCLSGSMAQSNHASANYFMDSLARYRHSLGLPAHTINWGAWSDIGAAASIKHSIEEIYGGLYFTPTQGINALRETLLSKRVQTLVVNFNQKVRHSSPSFYNCYLKDILRGNLNQNDEKSSNLDSKAFRESLKDLPLDGRSTIIQCHIEKIVREILKLPESEKINYFENFSALGLDSLMAVEMKNKLQTLMGNSISLNATTMLDYPSVKTLGDYLATLTFQNSDSPSDVSVHLKQSKNDLDLVNSDSILPAHIKPVDGHHKIPSEFRNILLTGVTGNLGVYILKNLVQRKNITVYCLVRHKSESGARGRVMEALRNNGLLEDLLNSNNQNNVVFLPGDITEEYFGLPKQLYDELASTIDCIHHFSSNINHLQAYEKSDNRHDIRSVNVLGLIRILEFASTSVNKHLFFPTSYSTLTNKNSDNFLNDDLNPEKIKLGFGLTKFVCEKLIKQAIQRGMNCSIFRLCTVIGSSKTGRFLSHKNHIATFFFACMKLGIFPSNVKGWNWLAVDSVAEIFVQLSFNDKIASDLYHICSPELLTKEDMQKICHEFNVKLDMVSTEEFANLFHANVANTVFNKFSELYPSVQDFLALFTVNGEDDSLLPVSSLYLEGNDNNKALSFMSQIDEKARLLIPNFSQLVANPMETLKRHIEYAIKSNILKL